MPGTSVEKFGSDDVRLILDVINGFWQLLDAHTESAMSQAEIGSSSRWDGAIFLMIPGTSCLATIVLSLRD
jgi:hypothetical protein